MTSNIKVTITPALNSSVNDKYYKLSLLLADLVVNKVNSPEDISCTFEFGWTGEGSDAPCVSIVSEGCSEKIYSANIESQINQRLQKIINSDARNYLEPDTDKALMREINAHFSQKQHFITARVQEIRELNELLRTGIKPIVQNSDVEKDFSFFLTSITDSQIPLETARRVLDLLVMEEA